ncbi:PAS domain-containing methyl-accepting chemotaxis protein [Salinisphaera sp.]|uniref:methyl-accepting chemotaxis protein n=1 Tax=Salinisphaera sp. TaxID=1914330 RepID=UPI000C353E01|nr:PAS domain-containing methyl-accepting chemotaxis protein [Salinisphaera sp.]MBS61488.1 chemotaxis protein [Salinisphaera sp.]
MRQNLPVTSNEYIIGEQEYLISQTDLDSHIVFANPAFIEASGFTWNELVGEPHNLIRHPDMPPEAFANFWETIRAGKTWTGIVKNRRKNGDHYWVHATVMPIIQQGRSMGYASVRRGATEEEKRQAERVYGRLRNGEKPRAHLVNGVIHEHSVKARLSRLRNVSFAARLALMTVVGVAGIIAMGALCAQELQMLHAITLQLGQESEAALTAAGVAIPESITQLESRTETMFDRMMLTMASVAGVFGVVLLVWGILLGRRIMQPLKEALALSRQIAAGNLTAEVETRRNDEVGRLMASLNVMRCSLVRIVQDVKNGIGVVAPATAEIAAGNADLSNRTEEQAAALEQTASSMEEITANVSQSAQSAQSASGLAQQAADTAERGGQEIDGVVDTMTQIAESSTQIHGIVGMIDDIAFQTNLLALNAAVEAARAGEHGRGFAVVADEVRTLSSRTAKSAREIKSLIEASSTRVETGSAQVGRTRDTMQGIVDSIREVSAMMQQVSLAAEEQRSGIQEIGVAVSRMDQMTQQNAALVEQSAASAQSVSSQASELGRSVDIFRIDHSPMVAQSVGAPQPATAPRRPASAPAQRPRHAEAQPSEAALA